jgi:hypothetical protein
MGDALGKMSRILAPSPLNSAHSMNTNRELLSRSAHFISNYKTQKYKTRYKIVFSMLKSVVLVQRSVEEFRRNKSEIINFSHVSTAH